MRSTLVNIALGCYVFRILLVLEPCCNKKSFHRNSQSRACYVRSVEYIDGGNLYYQKKRGEALKNPLLFRKLSQVKNLFTCGCRSRRSWRSWCSRRSRRSRFRSWRRRSWRSWCSCRSWRSWRSWRRGRRLLLATNSKCQREKHYH